MTKVVLVRSWLLFLLLSAVDALLTHDELKALLHQVAGDDNRMIRWDASEHTQAAQKVACDSTPAAAAVIAAKESSEADKAVAAEYLTYCITDNPVQRQNFAEQKIHAAVAEMVSSPHVRASATASHLIYIASYDNKQNQKAFGKKDVLDRLSAVVTESILTIDKEDSDATHSGAQIMWAAAALQNLAASYCDTEDDGRCYWFWDNGGELVLDEESLPVTSDGTPIRELIFNDKKLMNALIAYTCRGPVRGEIHDVQNIFPGENAVAHEHDHSTNIIAWATTGVLKNVALLTDARSYIDEHAMSCFCHMWVSDDWLEHEKGSGAMFHLRDESPCWSSEKMLCSNLDYLDKHGHTCGNFWDAAPDREPCQRVDLKGRPAKEACCACGGGEVLDDYTLGGEL